jgi:hypothetical protein
LILDSVFFSGSGLENILENFVESELAEALGTISYESWEPALNQRVNVEWLGEFCGNSS